MAELDRCMAIPTFRERENVAPLLLERHPAHSRLIAELPFVASSLDRARQVEYSEACLTVTNECEAWCF